MPTLAVRTALAANGTAEPLAGSQFEFLPYDAYIEFGIAADANGVLQSVLSGTDTLMEEGPVMAIKAINLPPTYPDDFHLNDAAPAGSRLKIKLRDTSGAARVVMTVLRITAV